MSHRAPPPLPENERRAWLAALDIPLWLPRTVDGTSPATPEPEAGGTSVAGESGAADEPAACGESPAGAEDTGIETVGGACATQPAVADMDWSALRETVLACRQCGLCETRTQAVFGVGSTAADLLIIGEAPGQEEDRRGEPFVGPAGQLLDRMLAAIRLDRQTVYITNVLKCRPPKNRDPHADEALACSPYLRRQIELMEPRVILAVGRVSAQQLLETDQTIGRLRGQWHRYGPFATPLLVTYHPAYLLRRPAEKARAWADLKMVRDALAAAG